MGKIEFSIPEIAETNATPTLNSIKPNASSIATIDTSKFSNGPL